MNPAAIAQTQKISSGSTGMDNAHTAESIPMNVVEENHVQHKTTRIRVVLVNN